MLQDILITPTLNQYISDTCCENGICVSIDETIPREKYVIIKVDEYYNSLNLPLTPPSIDCLIIRECANGSFGMTLVELKNIQKGSGFDLENMVGKFTTTLEDFIKMKFPILNAEYNEIKLFFVSQQELYKRDMGLKLEALMNIRFNFNGQKLMILPKMPTPTIKRCY